MLIRVGANRGFNTDLLQHWTYEPAPEPEPEPEPTPEPQADDVPAGEPQPDTQPSTEPVSAPYPGAAPEASAPESTATDEEPASEGTSKLILVFTAGELTLEGEEADKLQAYLRSKTGAAV